MKKGSKAILSSQDDIYGNTISIDNLKGKKVLLSFLRTAACPFCSLRVHELIKKQSAWKEKDLVIIAVFASPASEILNYAGKQKPPFAIVADPKEIVYRQYGIGHSFLGKLQAMSRFKEIYQILSKGFFNLKSFVEKTVMPADFLIDEQGMIVHSYYGKDFGDHIPFAQIEEWISTEDSTNNAKAIIEDYSVYQ